MLLLFERLPGTAHAMLTAAARARGAQLIVLDDDTCVFRVRGVTVADLRLRASAPGVLSACVAGLAAAAARRASGVDPPAATAGDAAAPATLVPGQQQPDGGGAVESEDDASGRRE